MDYNLGLAKIVMLENQVKLGSKILIHLQTFLELKSQALNFHICLSSRVLLLYKKDLDLFTAL